MPGPSYILSWGMRQLDQAQATQFKTLNLSLSCKGIKDDGCAVCCWSHASGRMVSGKLPQSLCEGGHRADEPQGLGVAWMWKCCSWRSCDPERDRQVLKSHHI